MSSTDNYRSLHIRANIILTKWLLWIEMAGVFIGIPLLLWGDVVPGHKSIVMLVVCISCLVLLLRDKSFDRSRFGSNNFASWRTFAVRAIIIASGLALYAFLAESGNVLAIPRHNPEIWTLIMITYPVLSVVPQEIIYRAFFFHRYGTLFENKKIAIVTNALLFGFAHILFKNWVAVIGAFVAGLLWAGTYLGSRSLLVVSLEHALYGNLVFTLGIGYYFYAPDF